MTPTEIMQHFTFQEWAENMENRQLVNRLAVSLAHKRHMGMEWRIQQELSKRAACGFVNEQASLKSANLRNKLMFESDYQAYKKAQG